MWIELNTELVCIEFPPVTFSSINFIPKEFYVDQLLSTKMSWPSTLILEIK